ncbi:hypothetical protein V6N13_072916 [Hibiscus sabdariffa]
MGSEEEALRMRGHLHDKWIYGSWIRVNMAKREPRNQFWRRKRGVSNPGDGFHKANVGDVPRTEPHTIRSVESLEMKDHLLVL